MFSLLIFISSLYSATFQITGPCDSTPLLTKEIIVSAPNVGIQTISILKSLNIPYQGDVSGIYQIWNSPTGNDAIEYLHDGSLKAHGWCFSVDQKVLEILPNEFQLTGHEKKIEWFFGYALLKNGQWEENCQRSNQGSTPPFCK